MMSYSSVLSDKSLLLGKCAMSDICVKNVTSEN